MTTTDFAVQISELRVEDDNPFLMYDVTVTAPNLTGTLAMHIYHSHASTRGNTMFVVNGIDYRVYDSYDMDGTVNSVRTYSLETGKAATPQIRRQIIKALTAAVREFVTPQRLAAQRMANADRAVAKAEAVLATAKAERDAAFHALAAFN